MSTSTPFTAESRREFLQEFFEMICWIDNFEHAVIPQSLKNTPTSEAAFRHENVLKDKLRDLAQQYEDRLPLIPLSRCPYCQAINSIPQGKRILKVSSSSSLSGVDTGRSTQPQSRPSHDT